MPFLPPDPRPEEIWGPLAVVENAGGMEALTEGIVRIDQDCAYLDHGPEKTLLVWPANRTRWQPPGSIVFERLDGERLVIENGHQYAFGGGSKPVVDWVNKPNLSCPEAPWLISDVALPN
jgi:hypothetical protein